MPVTSENGQSFDLKLADVDKKSTYIKLSLSRNKCLKQFLKVKVLVNFYKFVTLNSGGFCGSSVKSP